MRDFSKTILVRSLKPSFWNSCKSIVEGIQASYFKLSDEITIFDYHHEISDYTLIQNLEKTFLDKSNQIEEVIFIDHFPSIIKFINALETLDLKSRPKITIHTYGDFPLLCQEYIRIEDTLKKYLIKFITPSDRADKFILSHFSDNENISSTVLPFPIRVEKFYVKTKINNQFKQELGIDPNHKIISYVGRISSQKNSLFTLDVMSEYLAKDKTAHFVLAGGEDNFGFEFADQFESRGSIGLLFKEKLASLPSEISKRIHHLGQIEFGQVFKLLASTDVFLSLSTYHNEDFGMAPLEAACCGCPLLITDWGGYSNFNLSKEFSSLIKVDLKNDGLYIDKNNVLKQLETMLSNSLSIDIRQEISKTYHQYFSVDAVSKKLQAALEVPHKPFTKFSKQTKIYYWLNQQKTKVEISDSKIYPLLYGSFYE